MEKKRNTSQDWWGNPEGIRPLRWSVHECRDVRVGFKETGWKMWTGLMWIKMGISYSPCSKQGKEPYIHGSVHRDSILIRSNEMQQYAGVCLLQNYSTCFGCLSHPSSVVHQSVTAASSTGNSVRATTFRQCVLIRPRWRKVVVALTLWPVPKAAVKVWCTPDDGCDRHPKHVE